MLIQDIRPAESQRLKRASFMTSVEYSRHIPTDVLMNELWRRGVSIKKIFGRYYELDAMASAMGGETTLTVGDVDLAGLLPTKPIERQPF